MSWFETMPPFIFEFLSSECARAACSKVIESARTSVARLSSIVSDSPSSSAV